MVVVVPAHNEAANLPSVLGEIASLGLPLDVIVVDDGSSDETATVAEGAGAKVLRLPFNLGYGAAVQTGLLYAVDSSYDVCVLLDGDGQHDPRDVPALIAPVLRGEVDLVIGSRFLGRADYEIPFTRRLGMGLFRTLTSVVTRQRITDATSGFQAIGARLVKFLSDEYPRDFPDADTLIRLHRAGFRIGEVGVVIRPRLRGESMHHGMTTLYYLYKVLFSIFIVLTFRRGLSGETTHAARDQTHARHGQPGGDADHRAPRPAKTTR